uniref:transcription factor HES-7.1-B-like n=1 Tax=Monopterus albus TaxID=43700 RepID=UPI0009B31883|nr:transcription factor HES-7.1-B-like [Monopterus albus]
MRLSQEAEDATKDRKFTKSQVEKRRRERMNQSLKRLTDLLLQEPQQLGGTQHRVEKAEILEQTVLFLQNTAKGENTRTRVGSGGGDQKHSFQEGFAACLQRATHFLGPEGKGLWLGPVLDASFAAHFASLHFDSAGVQQRAQARFSSSSLPHSQSIIWVLRQKCKRDFGVNSFVHPYRLPAQQGLPGVPQQPQKNQLEIRVEGEASKQSLSQSHPVSQTLWRPWH